MPCVGHADPARRHSHPSPCSRGHRCEVFQIKSLGYSGSSLAEEEHSAELTARFQEKLAREDEKKEKKRQREEAAATVEEEEEEDEAARLVEESSEEEDDAKRRATQPKSRTNRANNRANRVGESADQVAPPRPSAKEAPPPPTGREMRSRKRS